MYSWETGEQYPCPRCGNLECNGCRPKAEVKPKDKKTESIVSELLAKADAIRAGQGEQSVTDNSGAANEGSIPSQSIESMAAILGRRGGLKGGKARAAALSQERRKEIARLAARARWQK